jgi:hypothetical protein
MKQITAISDDANQSMSVVLDTGAKVALTLEYKSNQKGWFLSMVYDTVLTLNGYRITTSPNILRKFRNVIPFGIACLMTDKNEPIYKDDFSTGRASLYILNADDVAYVEETVIPAYHG